VAKTILRYAGGKSRALKQITPFIEGHDFIVSPFIGGGSLEVHWASQGKKVYGFDLFDILVTFWKTLLSKPNELADKMRIIHPTKSTYAAVKEQLMRTPEVQEMIGDWGGRGYYKRKASQLDDLTLSAYYYFNHNCSYGPGFLGWISDIYMKNDGEKWISMIEKVDKFSCPTLKVEQASFEKVIPGFGKDMLYLDPPYFLPGDKENNKMHSGIYPMKNFPVHHSGFDHKLLRDLLEDHQGPFVLSYNDCPEIRAWYSDYDFHYPEWHYSLGQGELRVGKNRNDSKEEFGIKDFDKLETKLKGFLSNTLENKGKPEIKSMALHIVDEAKRLFSERDTDQPFMFEEVLNNSEIVKDIFEENPGLNKYIAALSGLNEKKSHEVLIVKK
tara:strand:- start:419 stop:1573 length:1155 start_codon:yes stop_codon:yes gene_type:complete